jgi:hypothetical protein
MMESGEEKKGFTVRDRRGAAQPEEAAKEKGRRAEGDSAKEPGKTEGERRERVQEPPLPEVNFSAFLLSLSTSALMHLGEVPDPATEKVGKDLPLAQQSIDLLGMLKEKTRGNLNPDEEKLLDHLLADLRWRYVKAAKE